MLVRDKDQLTSTEKEILKLISNENKPVSSKLLLTKGKFKSKHAFFSSLDYLVSKKMIEKTFNGKFVVPYTNGPITNKVYVGPIFLNSVGDGFVRPVDQQTKTTIYVNKINLKGVMNEDVVKVVTMDKKPMYDDAIDGLIVEIVERNRDYFVGTYYTETNEKGKSYKIVPTDQKINFDIIVDDDSQLVNGTKVLFKIGNINENKIYCTVSKIIGHINDVGSDIISIVYDNGIEPEFSEEVNLEVKNIDFNFSEKEDKRRKDLSHLNFVTIDPFTSKDMDDAIYVEKTNDGHKLYVAIADVSYYVKLNTELWKEATKRGTSIYLVNQVIPMLPHKLSNNICSLNPFEKRYSMVCEMDINSCGTYNKIDVYPAIIVSKKKFAYDNINQYFKTGEKLKDTSDDLYKMIDVAKELNKILDKRHKLEGYIDFEIPEPNIILDENEKIVDIQVKQTGKAQKMIENFMVAANEAVTIHFEKLNPNIPFVYRVHDSPDELKIEAFKTEAKKLGFKYDDSLKKWNPDTVSKWLINNANFEHKDLINILLLRTMAKAKYESTNIGHFGLSLKKYTHFTSPIRRLADVVVHHLYRAFVFDKDRYSDEQRQYLLNHLDELNSKSNETERIAVTTERDVNAMKFAEYMQTKIGQEFEGFASYIINFGVFVQLKNSIEGCIKTINLKDDIYLFDQDNFVMVGKKTKRVISLGQKMIIKVIGSDPVTKKIDFELVKFI